MNIKRGLKAITETVDENQDWYKYRRNICDNCTFNSKNSSPTNKVKDFIINTLEVIKPLINKEDIDSGNCNICTCYINKKCNDKLESCPMGKWKALSVQNSDLTINGVEGISGIEILKDKTTEYNIYLNDTLQGELIDFTLNIGSKKSKLISAQFSCPCAQIKEEPVINENHTYKIKATVSTAGKERRDLPHVVSLNLNFMRGNYLVKIYFKVK